ncbi:hypothetical protein IC229_11235 [Spirosoma sp. BT702]|uniref:Uncharacterized protein n=1 Tax=Spirosoma profusum TaxID=2771354 RepID=A0A926XVG3_9BACT|nr:hypothetical protein [Spirosoma profusum]MBD2701212.1 hypothetical protein [Spirosoma profusum]
MTTDSLRSNIDQPLRFWKSIILPLLSLFILSCSHEQKNNDSISQSDSVQIIQKVLDDPPLVSKLKNEFKEKQLKLVVGENIHPNSQLLFNNQVVSIVSYDSTTDEIRAKFPGKFFGQVPMFKVMPEGNVKVSIVFRGSGLTGLFELQRGQVGWAIIHRQFGRI